MWFVLLLMGSAIVYNILGLVFRSPLLLLFSLLISAFLVYAGAFYTVDVVSNGTVISLAERALMWFFGVAMITINAVFAFIFGTTESMRYVERRWPQ